MTTKEYRNKLIATFWVIAKKYIGVREAYEYGASLYPNKMQSWPQKGLSRLTVDELERLVKNMCVDIHGKVKMPVKGNPRPKPSAAPQRWTGNLTDPATPGQIARMNELANALNLDDEYFLGVCNKATGGIQNRVMTRLDAQKCIEALKRIEKRPETQTVYAEAVPGFVSHKVGVG